MGTKLNERAAPVVDSELGRINADFEDVVDESKQRGQRECRDEQCDIAELLRGQMA